MRTLIASIDLGPFPTHVMVSKKRRKKYRREKGRKVLVNKNTAGKPRYTKINGQKIYDQSIGRHTRAKVIEELHKFISDGLSQENLSSIATPVEIEAVLYAPWNLGGVRMVNGKISLPRSKHSRWDLLNMGWIWFKAFEDVLVKKGVIMDDDVQLVRSTGKITFVPVKDFYDRRLVFNIYKFTQDETVNKSIQRAS